MRVVVCPDKFRGSLTAQEARTAIGLGLRDAGLSDIAEVPMADGGEGTLDTLVAALDGSRHDVDTVDALGRPVRAQWGLLPGGTAVVEAAQCIGLGMLGHRRDPVAASSAGLGTVIASALGSRPARLVVGVGGVATTDGGLGCLDALGWDLRGVDTVVAADVSTRFVDAARLFAPQKGADEAQVAVLTARLQRLALRFAEQARDVAALPGSGAAGGIAGGLAAIGASIQPGAALVAEAVGLPAALSIASAVVTGEGRLDATSLQGKVVGAVLSMATRQRRAVLVGQADDAILDQLREAGTSVLTLRGLAVDADEAVREAASLLRSAAATVARTLAMA